MTSPSTYRNWFKTLVQNSASNAAFTGGFDVKDFYYADSTRFIEATRSKVEYPCLVLEVPTYFLPSNSLGNQYLVRLRGAFSIVIGCQRDDYEKQDDAQDKAMLIGLRVLGELKKAIKAQGAFFEGDAILEPVLSLIVDNNYGYRFEFSLSNIHLAAVSPC